LLFAKTTLRDFIGVDHLPWVMASAVDAPWLLHLVGEIENREDVTDPSAIEHLRQCWLYSVFSINRGRWPRWVLEALTLATVSSEHYPDSWFERELSAIQKDIAVVSEVESYEPDRLRPNNIGPALLIFGWLERHPSYLESPEVFRNCMAVMEYSIPGYVDKLVAILGEYVSRTTLIARCKALGDLCKKFGKRMDKILGFSYTFGIDAAISVGFPKSSTLEFEELKAQMVTRLTNYVTVSEDLFDGIYRWLSRLARLNHRGKPHRKATLAEFLLESSKWQTSGVAQGFAHFFGTKPSKTVAFLETSSEELHKLIFELRRTSNYASVKEEAGKPTGRLFMVSDAITFLLTNWIWYRMGFSPRRDGESGIGELVPSRLFRYKIMFSDVSSVSYDYSSFDSQLSGELLRAWIKLNTADPLLGTLLYNARYPEDIIVRGEFPMEGFSYDAVLDVSVTQSNDGLSSGALETSTTGTDISYSIVHAVAELNGVEIQYYWGMGDDVLLVTDRLSSGLFPLFMSGTGFKGNVQKMLSGRRAEFLREELSTGVPSHRYPLRAILALVCSKPWNTVVYDILQRVSAMATNFITAGGRLRAAGADDVLEIMKRDIKSYLISLGIRGSVSSALLESTVDSGGLGLSNTYTLSEKAPLFEGEFTVSPEWKVFDDRAQELVALQNLPSSAAPLIVRHWTRGVVSGIRGTLRVESASSYLEEELIPWSRRVKTFPVEVFEFNEDDWSLVQESVARGIDYVASLSREAVPINPLPSLPHGWDFTLLKLIFSELEAKSVSQKMRVLRRHFPGFYYSMSPYRNRMPGGVLLRLLEHGIAPGLFVSNLLGQTRSEVFSICAQFSLMHLMLRGRRNAEPKYWLSMANQIRERLCSRITEEYGDIQNW
jgi:hypothetical protein